MGTLSLNNAQGGNMALVVHLADARQAAAIKRGGLRASECSVRVATGVEPPDSGIFAMPVLPNYWATHQWLRELKRGGMRTLVAVHIRLRSDVPVWVGRYNAEHRRVPLGHAIGLIMQEPSFLGWEILLPFRVDRKAIHAIRDVPQVVGWRYFPDAHKDGPWKCLCNFCLDSVKGTIKARSHIARVLDERGEEGSNAEQPLRRTNRKAVKRPSPDRRP